MVDLSSLTPEARERSRRAFMDRLRTAALAGATPEAVALAEANMAHMRRVTAPGYLFPETPRPSE